MRTCLVCRRKRPKREMLRIVVDASGGIWPDPLARAPGRGAYLCLAPECLRRTPKGLRAIRGKQPHAHPDWPALSERIVAALAALVEARLRRAQPQAALGRDAVLRRIWYPPPLVVLLARDAGEALARQVGQAVAKRREAGRPVELVSGPPAAVLGSWLGRDRLAVVGVDGGIGAPLARWIAWLDRLDAEDWWKKGSHGQEVS